LLIESQDHEPCAVTPSTMRREYVKEMLEAVEKTRPADRLEKISQLEQALGRETKKEIDARIAR